MKGSKPMQESIKLYLDSFAKENKEFEKKYNNPKKNIEDCIKYILNTVQKKGVNGFTDGEVYGMAIHYYDEEQIDIGNAIDMIVKVNHHVEFSEEDKIKIVKEARDKVIKEEMDRMRKKPVKKAKSSIPRELQKKEDKVEKIIKPQQSLF